MRLVNAKYVKADLRGNQLKMNPRWSRTVYKIKSVKGTTGAGVPHYRVDVADCDSTAQQNNGSTACRYTIY
eukprot:SAG25_NODE_89_length_16305_cov_24.431630_5_plen_71_part_00